MTSAEHLIENAISCMESGEEYEDFAQGINREMSGNLEWYLKEIWQMADYVVNKLCFSCNKRMHWISVEDELPEPNTNDLLFADLDGSAYYGTFDGNNFHSGRFSYIPGKEVTHWILVDCLPCP